MKKVGIHLIWIILLAGGIRGYSQVDVLTQHNDLGRTGWNNQETTLNTSNVKTATFGILQSLNVDAQVYAQPLVVTGVNIGGTLRNVLYVATTNNTLYAFDADGASTTPFWTRNITEPGLGAPTNADLSSIINACNGNYLDFTSLIGIVGTPVIDKASGTLYVVARSRSTATLTSWVQKLHAINLSDGSDRVTPATITATINGSGQGGSTVTFSPIFQNQRPGLLLLNGVVYVAYASHCDAQPYFGWIFGYNAGTLAQMSVFCTSPNNNEGGIWMCGAAPSADAAGNIFVGTGNGMGTPSTTNIVESVFKLTPNANKTALSVATSFTPFNYQSLNSSDLDFGVTNVLLIPNTIMALAGCKDGNLYLVNKDNMGGRGASSNNILQTISVGSGNYLHSSLAYYKSSSHEYVYVWSENALLSAYPVIAASNQLGTTPATFAGQGPTGYSGAFLSVSSNGGNVGSGVLWATHASGGCNANNVNCPGILRAFDADNPGTELWNSSMVAADNVGTYAKFNNPTIANGKVYVATFSNQIKVYGLKAGTLCGTTNFALNKNASASSSTGANTAAKAVDGTAGTFWISSNSDNQNFAIDLGQKYDVCNIVINWDATNFGKNYNIRASNDSVTWTTVKAITNNNSASNVISLSANGYRYLQMQGLTRNNAAGSFSISEFQVYGTLSNACGSPANLNATNIAENSVTLNWNAVGGANNYTVQYKTVAAASWTTANTNTNTIALSALDCGTSYLFTVQANCASGASAISNGSFSTSTCTVSCTLPTRWSADDIGSPGAAGSSCNTGGTTGVFNMNGSGADIGSTSDQFQFANTFLNSDMSVQARVATLDASNPQNKLGLMMREDLSVGARNAFIGLTSASGLFFQYRNATGGGTTAQTVPGLVPPYWVKLAKTGTKYAAFYSVDGTGWTQVGTDVDLGFGSTASPLMGFAITSHNNTILSSGTIDGFSETVINPLAVHYLDFQGQSINNQYIQLTWSTDTEQNNDHFEVERSSDLLHFQTVGNVKGAGNSNTRQNYSSQDNNPVEGINYYRLKQVDIDGNFNYSNTIMVRFGNHVEPLVFPNPASTYITLLQGQEQISDVAIFDATGKLVKHVGNPGTASYFVITLTDIAPGVYIIRMKAGLSTYQQKLIKR